MWPSCGGAVAQDLLQELEADHAPKPGAGWAVQPIKESVSSMQYSFRPVVTHAYSLVRFSKDTSRRQKSVAVLLFSSKRYTQKESLKPRCFSWILSQVVNNQQSYQLISQSVNQSFDHRPEAPVFGMVVSALLDFAAFSNFSPAENIAPWNVQL